MWFSFRCAGVPIDQSDRVELLLEHRNERRHCERPDEDLHSGRLVLGPADGLDQTSSYLGVIVPEDPGRNVTNRFCKILPVSRKLRGRPVARRGDPLPVMALRQIVDAEDPDLDRLALRNDRSATPGRLSGLEERDLGVGPPPLHLRRRIGIDVRPEEAHEVLHGLRCAGPGEQNRSLRGRHETHSRASSGGRVSIDLGVEVS